MDEVRCMYVLISWMGLEVLQSRYCSTCAFLGEPEIIGGNPHSALKCGHLQYMS